jgi:hypothetical protein
MADGIDAAMNPMESSRRNPTVDRTRRQAYCYELATGTDTMLRRGEPCDCYVDRLNSTLTTNCVVNVELAAHGETIARADAREAR